MVQQSLPPERNYSNSERMHFTEAINHLLEIGAISECQPCKGQFLSDIFLVSKPNGQKRFILNLKMLNKFIQTDHFKLEDLRTAIKLITPDCHMATLDLKDAYFLIKIHEDSRKFLRFKFQGKTFEFNVLPFGLNTAPYIFTKITKPVVKLLRCAGLVSTLYLDDWLLIGDNYQSCLTNIDLTERLLISLGFIINYDKSVLVPSTSCKFLGIILDSHRFLTELPSEKRQRVKALLEKFLHIKQCKIREFAQLIGLLVSACPAIEYGWLHTKEMERCKYLNLKDNDNYNRIMNVPKSIHPDILWWLERIDHSTHRILQQDFRREVYSDASTTGWGAACNDETASGQWSHMERQCHINYLELLAAFIALKIFARDLSDCQILLRIDNSTAISYINRMGGIQYPHLTQISREIWDWCERRGLFVFASYIKSTDNTIADYESRRCHPDIEWELADWAFEALCSSFGTPDIDLFASRVNNKCSTYISWHRDPDAVAIDAFTVPWNSLNFYAFPPFSVILKTLRKIILDRAQGILVVPFWPTQPWYPLFRSLLISELVTFPSHNDVLLSHSSSRQIHKTITLVAGKLSGTR